MYQWDCLKKVSTIKGYCSIANLWGNLAISSPVLSVDAMTDD